MASLNAGSVANPGCNRVSHHIVYLDLNHHRADWFADQCCISDHWYCAGIAKHKKNNQKFLKILNAEVGKNCLLLQYHS